MLHPGYRARPELAELGRQHLSAVPAVYFAPSIPPDKEVNARAVHEAHLPPAEPILLLYDATLFGSAENGFVLTPERLCWKNLLEHPRQIPWGELDSGTVRPGEGRICVAGGGIQVSGDIVTRTAKLLVAMVHGYVKADAGPYRNNGDRGSDVVSRLVVLARKHIGEVEHVYFHPAIPRSKLRNARAVHAAHLGPGEAVAVLYDDTLFESARDGFLITAERLCWKNLVGEAASVPWRAIAPDQIAVTGNVLRLRGGTIHVTAGVELASKVAALLAAVKREVESDARK
jgi:hypothetical protein